MRPAAAHSASHQVPGVNVDAVGTAIDLRDSQEHQMDKLARQRRARGDEVMQATDGLSAFGRCLKPNCAGHRRFLQVEIGSGCRSNLIPRRLT